MGTEVGLTLGAQTEAAHAVKETANDLSDLLKNFGEGLEEGLEPLAFSAIATFGEGIKSWFEAAKPFPEGLGNYSKALVAVDSTTAQTDAKSAEDFSSVYSDIAALMGGAQ